MSGWIQATMQQNTITLSEEVNDRNFQETVLPRKRKLIIKRLPEMSTDYIYVS